jgi:hypothetical protein
MGSNIVGLPVEPKGRHDWKNRKAGLRYWQIDISSFFAFFHLTTLGFVIAYNCDLFCRQAVSARGRHLPMPRRKRIGSRSREKQEIAKNEK